LSAILPPAGYAGGDVPGVEQRRMVADRRQSPLVDRLLRRARRGATVERLDNARILIYSHDSFGLGHLRRCRAIAHAIVDRYKGVSVLILSGSPIIGSFDFLPRVDFVRIPGVVKLTNGEYQSLGLHIDLDQTMAIRAAIIRQTAESFRPHLFLVDKEPLGLKGEVLPTLKMLKAQGTTLVLGLRDIMDDPRLLLREWKRKKVLPALERLYDDIWVYGLAEFADPLHGVACPAEVRSKMIYTGYLRRSVPPMKTAEPPVTRDPYVLVTVGGGDDGMAVLDWVLSAYEQDSGIPLGAVIVTGPFMAPEQQRRFRERAERLQRIEVLTFDAHLEYLMARAVGVVAMAGYNTFCEILSLDKRAILVPRVRPRREQVMRARRAAALDLAHALDPEQPQDPAIMTAALQNLHRQPAPSERGAAEMLNGLDVITDLVAERVGRPSRRIRAVASQR
jgi:predicted glycosyltransferase